MRCVLLLHSNRDAHGVSIGIYYYIALLACAQNQALMGERQYRFWRRLALADDSGARLGCDDRCLSSMDLSGREHGAKASGRVDTGNAAAAASQDATNRLCAPR